MATELLLKPEASVHLERTYAREVRPRLPMKREFQFRFSAVVLGLLTVAAIIFAGYNLKLEKKMPVPYDGVWWVESGTSLIAERVHAQGPGELAGIKVGDRLLEVNDQPVPNAAAFERQIYKRGVYSESKLGTG